MKTFNRDELRNRWFVFAAGCFLLTGWSAAYAVNPICTALGTTADEGFGHVVAELGDVDGDRKADFLVSSPYFNNGGTCTTCGKVSVVSGADCHTLYSLTGKTTVIHFGISVTRLSNITGTGGLGFAVAALGDGSPNQAGYVRVYTASSSSAALKWERALNFTEQLWTVSEAGDFNGDGVTDVMLRSLRQNSDSSSLSAFTYILSGVNGGILDQKITSTNGQDMCRFAAVVPDYNNDGKLDYWSQEMGALGATSHLSVVASNPTSAGESVVYRFCPYGYTTNSSCASHNNGCGNEQVAKLADLVHNGYPAIAFGEPGASSGYTGVWIYAGKPNQNQTLLAHLTEELPNDEFGFSISTTHDLDGDNVPDILVGAPSGSAQGYGYAKIFSGATRELIYRIGSDTLDEQFGYSVAGIGDTNGDGLGEIVIGAPNYMSHRGRVLLFAGPRDSELLNQCDYFKIGPTTVCM